MGPGTRPSRRESMNLTRAFFESRKDIEDAFIGTKSSKNERILEAYQTFFVNIAFKGSYFANFAFFAFREESQRDLSKKSVEGYSVRSFFRDLAENVHNLKKE